MVIGGLQGVAELFPVSSLGHCILIPALVGGSWARDHVFRVYLSKPIPTAAFLALNGLALLWAERLRRRGDGRADGPASGRPAASPATVRAEDAADLRLPRLAIDRAVLIGAAQIAALAPGIRRSPGATVTDTPCRA
jgi:undecaprenyl-diphosphatase